MKIRDIENVRRGLELLRHGAKMGRDGFTPKYQARLLRQYEKSKKSFREMTKGMEGG